MGRNTICEYKIFPYVSSIGLWVPTDTSHPAFRTLFVNPLPWEHKFNVPINAREECMNYWQLLHKRPKMRNVPQRKCAT